MSESLWRRLGAVSAQRKAIDAQVCVLCVAVVAMVYVAEGHALCREGCVSPVEMACIGTIFFDGGGSLFLEMIGIKLGTILCFCFFLQCIGSFIGSFVLRFGTVFRVKNMWSIVLTESISDDIACRTGLSRR